MSEEVNGIVDENAQLVDNTTVDQELPQESVVSDDDSTTVVNDPDQGDGDVTKPEVKDKAFTQKELDALITKRLAREQRKWEREFASKLEESKASNKSLNIDDYENINDYAETLAEQKAQELLHQKEAKRQFDSLMSAYEDSEEKARDKYSDFDDTVSARNLTITEHMGDAILASDDGAEILYYLGRNPKLADKIAQLSPTIQAKEIGKIEARLLDTPNIKKVSSAPAPISGAKANGSSNAVYDTTDARSVKSMSIDEWIKAENARAAKLGRGF